MLKTLKGACKQRKISRVNSGLTYFCINVFDSEYTAYYTFELTLLNNNIINKENTTIEIFIALQN